MRADAVAVTGTATTALRWRPLSGRAPRQIVVLCHGLGGDAGQLAPSVPRWAAAAPDAIFVAPCAPHRRRLGLREMLPPRRAERGHQWFDIDTNLPNHSDAGVRRAAMWLDRFIDTEHAAPGLEAAPYVLIGFSQGAMTALFTGLRRATPPAAIISFAGSLLAPDTLPRELRNHAKVVLVHGDADTVVPPSASVAAHGVLMRNEVPVELIRRPGVGHTLDAGGIEIGAGWLGQIFA